MRSVPSSDGEERASSPGTVAVPDDAIQRPANYARPRSIGRSIPAGSRARVIATASTNGIPSAALNAYQRAETVMNAADKACNIPWQLIAAIGRVESDHGRYGGNTLGADGVSRPGILGIPLNGRHGIAKIADTDAGQYDNDAVWDRAVGPMQFIPSTWSVVGVDADGDAKRSPQDIDDAALAAAVYLCSGPNDGPGADLSTEAGQRTSLFRYNHSREYVDLVLSIMDAYLEGDYTSVPNYVASAVTFTPDFQGTRPGHAGGTTTSVVGALDGAGTSTGGNAPEPVDEPTQPTVKPSDQPDPVAKLTKTVTNTTSAVTDLLTLPQATLKCTALGYSPLLTRAAWSACLGANTA